MPSQKTTQSDVRANVTAVTPTPEGLEISYSQHAQPRIFSWFWLRDHGIDEASLDPVTLQRRVDTFTIPQELSAESVTLDETTGLIQLEWSDGISTTVPMQLLLGLDGNAPLSHDLTPGRPAILWDRDAPLTDLPRVSYSDVMSSDQGLLDWLEKIAIYGFALVDGVPTGDQETEALAARIDSPMETLFGRMWHLSAEQADHGDTAYTTQFLEPHTDASYYHDAAGLQMFNCQVFDGKGGESIQVDAFAIAQRIKNDDPEAYATLCEVSVPGHYLEPGVHVRAERPTFRLDSKGQVIQVTFNNYDRAPMLLAKEQEKHFYRAYSLFHKHAMDQRNWLKISLRPGNALIFDNWRNMHGRMGYVGKRVFYGCYHSRSSFESKLRVLRAGLPQDKF